MQTCSCKGTSHLATFPTHCLKTRGTVPFFLVCLIKHVVQLSGHLRYRSTRLRITVVEIVLRDEHVDFHWPNVRVVAVENSIDSEFCLLRLLHSLQTVTLQLQL